MQEYSYIAKVVMIGDSGCGKSSLMYRLTDDRFLEAHDVTLGADFGSQIMRISGKGIKLQIWDTAGQETYRSVTRSYFRGSSGALLIFDIARRETFDHAKDWLRDLRSAAGEHVCALLIGNKSDLQAARQVERAEAEVWARLNGVLQYMETSARTGDNVQEAFRELATRILEDIENGRLDVGHRASGVRIEPKAPGSCC